MTDFYLILKNLTRNKLRLTFNSFAILIAFFLFGVLGSIRYAFDAGVELSADDRLVVVNKINFTQVMPLAYVNKVKAIEGVSNVTYANWFGSYYQEPRKQAMGFSVDAESYLDVYSNLQLSEEQREAWFKERRGMIVGADLASIYGWKLGDTIPISSTIFSKSDSSNTWEMTISGIFTDEGTGAATNYMLFHYDYLMEAQTFGRDWIGWMTLTTEDPSLNEIVAKKIDDNFVNSSAETKTSTEKAFNQAFIKQVGSIGLIITSVVSAAFFTILLIVGNTMALSIRERTGEIAVLKTIGFSSQRIFKMVLVESVALASIGGLLGFSAAVVLINGMSEVPDIQRFLPNLVMPDSVTIQALSMMLGLGLVTGFFPALRAMRLKTIDALSRGQ